jgi:hypothetical protein
VIEMAAGDTTVGSTPSCVVVVEVMQKHYSSQSSHVKQLKLSLVNWFRRTVFRTIEKRAFFVCLGLQNSEGCFGFPNKRAPLPMLCCNKQIIQARRPSIVPADMRSEHPIIP